MQETKRVSKMKSRFVSRFKVGKEFSSFLCIHIFLMQLEAFFNGSYIDEVSSRRAKYQHGRQARFLVDFSRSQGTDYTLLIARQPPFFAFDRLLPLLIQKK